jgi:hypothetical protein
MAVCSHCGGTGIEPDPLAIRFWKKVDRRGPDECWPWIGAKGTAGYGHIKIGNRNRPAHRIAVELTGGRAVSDGAVVRHSCDNPPCVNPAHLIVGTQLENIADRDTRGRGTRGERSPTAKLTAEQVRAIRATHAAGGYTLREIAAQFDVTHATVVRIVNGQAWRHV